jgi:hypothetical protein
MNEHGRDAKSTEVVVWGSDHEAFIADLFLGGTSAVARETPRYWMTRFGGTSSATGG